MSLLDERPDLRPLGIEIQRRRTAKGLSLQALADIVQIEKQTLHLYENAKMQPGVGMVWRIARALDVSLSELVSVLNEGAAEERR